MQKILPILYYIYAGILVGGGVMGSMVSKKPSSLIGSGIFAAVAVAAALMARTNPRVGFIIGLVDALAVTGFFIYRYMETGKAMPAIPSIILSLLVAGCTVAALMGMSQENSR